MASNVYYSVCPFGTGDIKTGTPTCTISTGAMTISVTQTGNIGIGCRITYNTTSVCYISAVNSPTSFNVVTAIGGAPSDEASPVDVNSIAHEYASLSAFESGFTDANHINNTDLTAADVVAHACCYYDHDDDTVDTAQVIISGTTMDTTRYLKIFTPTGGNQSINNQQHNGTYQANKYRMAPTGQYAISIVDAHTTIEGIALRIRENFVTGRIGITFANISSSSISTINKCIIQPYDSNTDGGFGISCGYQFGLANATVNILNTIVSGFSDTGGRGISLAEADFTVNLLNCAITNNESAIYHTGATTTVTNCAIFNNTDDISGTVTLTYSAGDDADFGSGTGNIQWTSEATDWAANFTDYTNGDFSVKDTNADIYNAGTDLSASGVTEDIIGTTRPQSTSYDIGAFEYIVAAGGSSTDLFDGKIIISNLATNLFDGKSIVKDSATNLFDGKTIILDISTNLFDGKTVIKDITTDLFDGKTIIRDVSTINFDGKTIILDIATDNFDGKAIISDVSTINFDGKTIIKDFTTDLFDGKAIVKDSSSINFDGKAIIRNISTNLFDGKTIVANVSTNLFDGKAIIRDVSTNLFDGKAIIRDIATDSFDGKTIISQISTDLFDGKAVVKDVLTNLFDGKAVIKDIATDLFDGKTIINKLDLNLFDSKVVIKDSYTDVFDGKVIVANVSTNLFDGKLIITQLASGLVSVSLSSTNPDMVFSANIPLIIFSNSTPNITFS